MTAPVLIDCRELSKAYGERPLFEDLSFTLHEGERVGVIGPNGAGKSTLLRILAGLETPDRGSCARRKGLRLGYVPQQPDFDPGLTVKAVVAAAGGADDHRAGMALSRAGFVDQERRIGDLSGGWLTRLAVARALVNDPDLLLLDEPTNHLDLDSILWLESLLESAAPTFVTISHDRYFLQNVANRMLDLDRVHPAGLLSVRGAYAELLEERDRHLSSQAAYRESLANRVRREIAWLRRGAKARTSKSRARIEAAERSMAELAETDERLRSESVGLELTASGRKTRRLWHGRGLRKSFGETTVVQDLELLLTPGMRLGVMGPIGSGKSTLLKIIVGELEADAGHIRAADDLRVVYFDQGRETLDDEATLRRALAPEGDGLVHRGRPVHVVTWARRFLFRTEQLDQPVSRLSGGERARVVLARTMLRPADLLVLDEPTNDLDVATLEVLEESLLEFSGALVLVSHDRHLVDRVTTEILALDGEGNAVRYADYDQWQAGRRAKAVAKALPRDGKGGKSGKRDPARRARRLTYMEQREWEGMEERVLGAEARLDDAKTRAEDPTIATDAAALERRVQELEEARREVDRLYERWAELEAKQG
jgi:ATP-binding cassette subfamily F protein uup